eukprot:GHUV01018946.1.p1 GENE.GHUV01018946.1~~GHUV01018946.1.p1  ORF type:complete len:448 (+),score=223.83 GHUV01018946.1:2050-3393(+)
MVQAGAHVREEVVNSLIVLITNAEDLHGYAVRRMYAALQQNLGTADTSLLTAAAWCIGEFGEMLPTGRGGALLEGEPPVTVSEADVVLLLESVLRRTKLPAAVKEVVLTAAMKLTARLPTQVARLAALVERNKSSVLLEVQNRSCEYSRMLGAHSDIAPQLLERMPALDEQEYYRTTGVGPVATPSGSAGGADAAAAAAAAPAAAAVPAGDDLVDLLGGLDAATAAVGRASQSGAGGGGLDMLGITAAVGGGSSGVAAAGALDDLLSSGLLGPSPAAAPAAAGDILGMLGDVGPAPAPAAQAVDPLANLLGSSPPKAAAAVARPATPAAATLSVLDQDGLSVRFACSKTPGQPGSTDILATYSNSGLDTISDFNLQAAVPKYMQLRLEPASGTALPALGAGSVTQALHITNTMHGQKPLVMRLRLNFSRDGQPVVQQVEVNNFPAGF